MKNLHDLKAEITKSNISLSVIIKKFSEIYNQNLSKTALSLYLNQGIEPKKINNLYEKLEDILKKIKSSGGRTMIPSIYLSNEAKQHFKLKSDPFAPYLTKLSDIIMLQSHYYADEMLKTAANACMFVIITGEVGSGKTTVRDKFLEENKSTNRFTPIIPESDAGHLTAREILNAIVYELSGDTPKRNMEALAMQVKKLLKQRQKAGEKVVLIIDEAQDLHTQTLKYIKRLWEKKDGLTALLGIALIGQPEFATRLYGQSNAEIREVVARTTHIALEPINDELQAYLSHKIKQAGGNISNIITDDAVACLSEKLTLQDRNNKVQQIAYPLETGNIMKLLMNKAVMMGEELITKELVESIKL